MSERSWGKIKQPVVLPDLRGKGHVRQRSISADLIYSLVFVFIGAHYLAALGLGYFSSRKSNWPSRGQERVYARQAALYSIEIASFLTMTCEEETLVIHLNFRYICIHNSPVS